ncbi:MAG: YbaN family protein [Polaromonas sp.]|nr:YbaN family protein [Polaromonas sp.]
MPAPGTPATPTPQPPRLLPLPLRWLLMAFAVASLCMGIIGIFVPGLPTTVFVLLAAWAAARSSPRMHHWLLAHRLFGPTIRNWHNGGRMSRRAKWSATVMMGLCIAVLFFTTSREWLAEALTVFMLLILLWLWRRPEPPEGRLP